MDFSALSEPFVIALSLAAAIVGLIVGFLIGKSGERKRKRVALTQAEEKAQADLHRVLGEHEQRIETLAKEHQNGLSTLKQEHADQLGALKREHTSELERVSSEHAGLIEKLNATNMANLNQVTAELNQEHQNVVQALREKHEQAMAAVRRDGEQNLERLERERDRQAAELQQHHEAEVARLKVRIDELSTEQKELSTTLADREQTVAKLNADIAEAQLKNSFAVSRSGERLIRVVRSVQELANELEETSRTVTNGEYSFFTAIKDQRDRETVLNLTGGVAGHTHDQKGTDEPAAEAQEQPEEPESGHEDGPDR
ncbi:coiled-coil domain-containing protein [Thiohalomonas denitrificans]|uniref:DNA recombination protein RmuC n=1 Tax=Thiohalomonas denitrificans TaxID=415747 RepID=A0A1G5QKG8_9GAMM|nr:hypothetical protein [Thiohalomonas denitrificans]SCZ62314.1 hypothetical protein SAMN03097708_02298 [Thiohalomonas denitrificans]